MAVRSLFLLAPLAAVALASSAAVGVKTATATVVSASAASSSSSLAPAVETGTTGTKTPKCPEWLDGVPVPVEHASDVCDFKSENSPYAYKKIAVDLHASLNSGRLYQMKDERTWICPEDDDAGITEGDDFATGQHPLAGLGGGIAGPKAKWVVRNRSSNPVSVSLVDTGRGNREVSAANPKIFPAHADPDAVLAPGAWRSLAVTLGTILHVRELVSVGDDVSPGRVLIRHRPGPIAVRDTTIKPVKKPKLPAGNNKNKKGKAKTSPTNGNKNNKGKNNGKKGAVTKAGGSTVKDDTRNLGSSINLGGNTTSTAAKARAASKQVLKPLLPDATPPLATRAEQEAQRGKFALNRMCNSLTRLFVNRVGKPIDVYWAGASDLTTGSTSIANRADDCDARYAFHLGLKSSPHEDFFEEWDSFMSLENSYLGHHFVARLASNHSKVLQEIVMDRTDVGDCVREKEVTGIGGGMVKVGVQVGGTVDNGEAKKNVLVHEIVVDGYGVAASMNLTGASSAAGLGGVGSAAA